jgi:hypothetical protein
MSARAAYYIRLAISARASCCSGALALRFALDAGDRSGRRGRGNSPAPLREAPSMTKLPICPTITRVKDGGG